MAYCPQTTIVNTNITNVYPQVQVAYPQVMALPGNHRYDFSDYATPLPLPSDHDATQMGSQIGRSIREFKGKTPVQKKRILAITLFAVTVAISLGLLLAGIFTGNILLAIVGGLSLVGSAIGFGIFMGRMLNKIDFDNPKERAKIRENFNENPFMALDDFSKDKIKGYDLYADALQGLPLKDKALFYCKALRMQDRWEELKDAKNTQMRRIQQVFDDNTRHLVEWRDSYKHDFAMINAQRCVRHNESPLFNNRLTLHELERERNNDLYFDQQMSPWRGWKKLEESNVTRAYHKTLCQLGKQFRTYMPNPADIRNHRLLNDALLASRNRNLLDWENVEDNMPERTQFLPRLLLIDLLKLGTPEACQKAMCLESFASVATLRNIKTAMDTIGRRNSDELAILPQALVNTDAPFFASDDVKTLSLQISAITQKLMNHRPFYMRLDNALQQLPPVEH